MQRQALPLSTKTISLSLSLSLNKYPPHLQKNKIDKILERKEEMNKKKSEEKKEGRKEEEEKKEKEMFVGRNTLTRDFATKKLTIGPLKRLWNDRFRPRCGMRLSHFLTLRKMA